MISPFECCPGQCSVGGCVSSLGLVCSIRAINGGRGTVERSSHHNEVSLTSPLCYANGGAKSPPVHSLGDEYINPLKYQQLDSTRLPILFFSRCWRTHTQWSDQYGNWFWGVLILKHIYLVVHIWYHYGWFQISGGFFFEKTYKKKLAIKFEKKKV